MVPRVRIELTTPASSGLRSTTELPRRTIIFSSKQRVRSFFSFFFELHVQRTKDGEKNQHERGDKCSRSPEAKTTGDSDSGNDPQRGGRCKAADPTRCLDDDPGSQESNSLHHDACNACRVRTSALRTHDPNDGHERRSYADQAVRADARRLLPELTLNPNQCRKAESRPQTQADFEDGKFHRNGRSIRTALPNVNVSGTIFALQKPTGGLKKEGV